MTLRHPMLATICMWSAAAFGPTLKPATRSFPTRRLASTENTADDASIQWELFKKYHAKGSWKGIWTTYDYIGDVLDETVASVELIKSDERGTVEQTHNIVVGARRSDCATCFDSMETKEIPVATYSPDNLRKCRFASCSMVNGPTLLRSGAMATELVLSKGDGRVRVVFQHAPVWERGVEPGSCPPQGLKLFRTMISREALRSQPPTAETEQADPPAASMPIFYRPVPPFNWHKKWGGTSWTWGPATGDRGWAIDQIEEGDDWHGSAPVEAWNLRLPGGLFVQAPRVITDAEAGLCRMAWLPDDETLLRVEAGVIALQPMLLDDDSLAGFEPPSLASLRCDALQKMGDLQGEPVFARKTIEEPMASEESSAAENTKVINSKNDLPDDDDAPDSGLQAIRDALQL